MPRCENPTPTSTSEISRALLIAMDAWVDRGVEPPASNYPRVEDGTLVPLSEVRRAFPAIPGVKVPVALNDLALLDFGPTFGRHGGILAWQPPRTSHTYTALVPKPDDDGLDIAGARSMRVRVPLGTSTGWNVRAAGHRPGDLCGLTGSFVPFARTVAERQASGDPRRSLQERYVNREGFVRAVEQAAKALVESRFLLQEDADRFIAAAKASDVFGATGTVSASGR